MGAGEHVVVGLRSYLLLTIRIRRQYQEFDVNSRPSEVDQEAKWQTCRFQIVQALRRVDFIKELDRLNLNEH